MKPSDQLTSNEEDMVCLLMQLIKRIEANHDYNSNASRDDLTNACKAVLRKLPDFMQ